MADVRLRFAELVSWPLEIANVVLVLAFATWAILVGGEASAAMAGVMVFDFAMLWLAVGSFVLEKRTVPAEDGARYVALSRRRARLLARFVEWVILGSNAALASIFWVGPVPMLVVVCLVLIGPMAFYLPPLTRVQREMRAIAGTNVPGTRRDGWRGGGLIYYAPDDPSLVVPKRIGIGSTLNFAHPAAWVLLGAVLVLPILLTLIAAVLA